MKVQVKFNFETICNNLIASKLDVLEIAYHLNPPGEIEILQKLTKEQTSQLLKELNSSGIEVVNDQQLILVQRIKELLNIIVRLDGSESRIKISSYLEEKLPYSYSYLSRVFSEVEHMVIEKFLILKKIDYAKELLTEDQLSLTEIAFKLNYSSVAHLSKQFKKTTGFSPSNFINLKRKIKSNL